MTAARRRPFWEYQTPGKVPPIGREPLIRPGACPTCGAYPACELPTRPAAAVADEESP